MLESLTGLGLATSAGLNAYIPLLAIGVLARYTDLITLPGNGGLVMALLEWARAPSDTPKKP